MLIEPMLMLSTGVPLSGASGSIASQGRSWWDEAMGLWPVLLVSLGLAIVLAMAWRWWSSRREPATDHVASAEHLRQLAHQVAEDLDAKSDRLAMLIKHADRRINALSELTEGIGDETTIVTRTGRRGEPVGSSRAVMADPVTEQVYQMADSGLTTVQIAQKLCQPTGNVELMLALRR